MKQQQPAKITDYRNGVAYFNARLAQEFGRKQFVLCRGNGYYYFHGDHFCSMRVTSIYWGDMAISTPRECLSVEQQVAATISEIRSLIS